MKVYRVFTDEVCKSMFPSHVINSVTVLANSEDDAKDMVEKRYGDQFLVYRDGYETEVIVDDINTSAILSIEYCPEDK